MKEKFSFNLNLVSELAPLQLSKKDANAKKARKGVDPSTSTLGETPEESKVGWRTVQTTTPATLKAPTHPTTHPAFKLFDIFVKKRFFHINSAFAI